MDFENVGTRTPYAHLRSLSILGYDVLCVEVDPSEITGFKSVLPNNVPHDPDVFGDMSKTDMEEWWREAP